MLVKRRADYCINDSPNTKTLKEQWIEIGKPKIFYAIYLYGLDVSKTGDLYKLYGPPIKSRNGSNYCTIFHMCSDDLHSNNCRCNGWDTDYKYFKCFNITKKFKLLFGNVNYIEKFIK